jgi:hypothetical protein
MADDGKLTDDERAIWNAAYGAAFVEEFRRIVDVCGQHPSPPLAGEQWVLPFDRAMQMMTAEGAITVADAAVRRLRDWRPNRPGAGITLGSWPKEWEEP